MTSMWPLDFDRTRFDQQMEGMTLVMGRPGTLGQQFFGKPVRFWNFDFKFFKTFYLAWFFGMCGLDVGKCGCDRFNHVTDMEHMFR